MPTTVQAWHLASFTVKYKLLSVASFNSWLNLLNSNKCLLHVSYHTAFCSFKLCTRTGTTAVDLHLMTDRPHHWTLRHRIPINHFWTFLTSCARCSGSDFRIWSNSANLPGLKKTFVRPNLKSTSFKPSALNRAYKTERVPAAQGKCIRHSKTRALLLPC